MMVNHPEQGLRKSALLLRSLEPRQAEEILSRLPESAADALRQEMELVEDVTDDAMRAICGEFEVAMARPRCATVDRSPQQIVGSIRNEHPQAIAVALSALPNDLSARCLEQFPVQTQIEVVSRLAELKRVEPRVMREVIATVESAQETGEAELIAQVLDEARHDETPHAVGNLQLDDLLRLEHSDLQTVLGEVQERDLEIALGAASRAIRERVREVMPEALKTNASAPVRLAEFEAAQAKILRVLHRLEAAGDVTFVRPGGRR